MRFDKSIVGGYVEPKELPQADVEFLSSPFGEGVHQYLLQMYGLPPYATSDEARAAVTKLREGVAPIYGEQQAHPKFKVGDNVLVVSICGGMDTCWLQSIAEVMEFDGTIYRIRGKWDLVKGMQCFVSENMIDTLPSCYAHLVEKPATPGDLKCGDEVVIVQPTNEMPGRAYLQKAIFESVGLPYLADRTHARIAWDGKWFIVPLDAIVKMTPISDEQYRIDLALELATAVGDDLDRVGALLGVKRATQAPPIPADVRFD